MTIAKIKKNDKEVSVQEHLIGKRQEHSLCWQDCKYFKPMTTTNCPIAQGLYEYNIINGIATAVWECPKYQNK
jgi:hypothetical protein